MFLMMGKDGYSLITIGDPDVIHNGFSRTTRYLIPVHVRFNPFPYPVVYFYGLLTSSYISKIFKRRICKSLKRRIVCEHNMISFQGERQHCTPISNLILCKLFKK